MELSRVAFNKRILTSVLSFVLLISFNSIVYGQRSSINPPSVGLDEQPCDIHVTSAVGGWSAVDDAPSIGADCSDPAKARSSTSQEQAANAEQLAIKIRPLIQGISVYNEQPVLGSGGVSINSPPARLPVLRGAQRSDRPYGRGRPESAGPVDFGLRNGLRSLVARQSVWVSKRRGFDEGRSSHEMPEGFRCHPAGPDFRPELRTSWLPSD